MRRDAESSHCRSGSTPIWSWSTGPAARRADKPGRIPAHLRPILEQLRVSEETVVETVTHFGRMFLQRVGRRVFRKSPRRGCRWLAGVRNSRKIFA